MKYWCGIDKGKEGGIAIYSEEGKLKYFPMPVNEADDTDFLKLLAILKKLPSNTHIVTEKLQALAGVRSKATFTFARQSAIVECAILASGLPFTEVSPKKWTSFMWQDQKLIMKSKVVGKHDSGDAMVKSKTDSKAMSLSVAKKLFPSYDFLANNRSKKPHNGIIDAVLLAVYGKRNNF